MAPALRLKLATSMTSVADYSQSFAYNRAASMTANSRVGSYAYGASRARHAPVSVTNGGTVTALPYDANGNMTLGLGGKAMAYDRENRPLSVTFGTRRTCYVYGADGARLKKIENLAANQNCATIPATAPVTLYFGPVEIRDFKGAGEQILTYPHPKLRLVHSAGSPVAVSYLHGDHLGSLRAVTDAAGAPMERATYRPYGVQTETVLTLAPNETKGFIGQRYDADAGLQYLNARYYDPALALFVQPDWFPAAEVLRGTFVARDGKFMELVPGTPHGRALLDRGFILAAEVAGRAEARMAALLAGWLLRQGAVERLGDPALTGATVVAALNGLTTSARILEDYRAGQAMLGRMLGLALGR